MGHVRGGFGAYGKLQKRLNRFPIGAPPAKELYEILRVLFSEEEASVASRMPLRFSSINKISGLTGKNEKDLLPLLEKMADKGLVAGSGQAHLSVTQTCPRAKRTEESRSLWVDRRFFASLRPVLEQSEGMTLRVTLKSLNSMLVRIRHPNYEHRYLASTFECYMTSVSKPSGHVS